MTVTQGLNPEFSEHSHSAKAKKVVDGPVAVQFDEATGQSILAEGGTVALGGALTLTRGKNYRVSIIGGGAHVKLANATVAATTGDLYLAEGAHLLSTNQWFVLNHIAAGGASIQAIEMR